jgi:hypothetical protein
VRDLPITRFNYPRLIGRQEYTPHYGQSAFENGTFDIHCTPRPLGEPFGPMTSRLAIQEADIEHSAQPTATRENRIGLGDGPMRLEHGADLSDRQRVAQIAQRQAAHPLSGGGEDGVAQRGRQRREGGFTHASRQIV